MQFSVMKCQSDRYLKFKHYTGRKNTLTILILCGLFILVFFIVTSSLKLYYQRKAHTSVSIELLEGTGTDEATTKMLRKNSEIEKEPKLSKRDQFEMKYSNIDYRVAMTNGLFNDTGRGNCIPTFHKFERLFSVQLPFPP